VDDGEYAAQEGPAVLNVVGIVIPADSAAQIIYTADVGALVFRCAGTRRIVSGYSPGFVDDAVERVVEFTADDDGAKAVYPPEAGIIGARIGVVRISACSCADETCDGVARRCLVAGDGPVFEMPQATV
jgi:hypothetical protein